MALHFTKDKVDERLAADVAAAARLPNEAFQELALLIFAILTQSKPASRMLELVQAFGEENGIQEAALKSMVRAWLTFLRSSHRANSTPQHVFQDLLELGVPEDKAKLMGKGYKVNLVAMARSVVGRTLSVNQLVDMVWRFGVTSGSSEFRKTGNGFLQLKVTTVNGGSGPENALMELTLPQFYEFLHEMEKAKAALDFLS